MATWLRIFGVLVLLAMTVADPGPSASKEDFLQRTSLWPYSYAMGYPKSVQTLLRIKKDGQKNPQLHADDKKIRASPRCTDCDNGNPKGGDGGYGNQVRDEYQSGRVCNIKSRHMDFVPSKIDLYMNGAERRYNMPCRIRTQRPPDTKYPEYWEEPVYGGSYQQSISFIPSQAPAYGGEMEYAALGGYSEGSAYPNDYGDESEEYSSGLDDFPEYSETYDEANGSGGADLYMSTPQGPSENYEGDKEAFPGETSGPTSVSNHGMYSDGKKDGNENKVYEDSKDYTSPAEDQSGDTDYSLYSQGYGLSTGSSSSGDSYQLMSPVYSKYFYENTAYEDSEDSKSSTAPETEYTGHSMYSLGYGSTIGTTSEDSDVKVGGANSYQTYSMDESSEENEAKYDPQNDNYLNVFAKLYPKILQNGAPKDYKSEAYTIYSKGYGVVKDSPQEVAIPDGKGSDDPVYSHESEKDGSKLEGNGYGNGGSIYSKEYEEETSDKGLNSDKKGEEDSTNNQDAENKKSPTASKTEGYDFGYSNSIYSKAYEEDNESSAKGPPIVEKGSEDNSYSKEYEDEKETSGNEYSNGYGEKQLNHPSYSEDADTEEGYSEGTKGEETDSSYSYSSYSEDYGEEETNGKDYSNENGDEGDNQYIYTQDVEEKGYSEEDHPSDSKNEGNGSNDGNSKYPKVDEDEMENPGEYSTYEEKDGYDYSNYQDLAEGEESMDEEDGSYSKGDDSENEGTAEDYSSGNGGKEFHQSDYSQDAEAEKGSSEQGYSEDSKTDGNVSTDDQSEYSKGAEGEEEYPEEYSTPEESESDDSTPFKNTEEKLDSSEGSITQENDSKNNFYEDSKKKPSSEDTAATTSSDDSEDNDSDKDSEAADKPQSSEDLHGDAAEMEAEPSTSEESISDATADATEKTDPSKEHAYTDEKNESEELSKILKGMDIEDFGKACKYLEEYRESLSRADAAPDLTPYKGSEQDGKIFTPASSKDSQQKESMESPKESIPVEKERQSSSGTTEDSKKKEKELQHRFTSRARSNESPEDDSSEVTIKQNGDKYSSKKPLNLYKMLVSHFSQQKSHPQYSNFFHLGQSAYPNIYGGGSYANHYMPYNQLPSTPVHSSQYAQFFHKYYPKKDNQPYSQYLNNYAPVHHQNHLVYMPNIKTHPKLFNSNHPQHLVGNYAQFYHNYYTPTSNQHSKPPHSAQYMQGFPVSHYSQPGQQLEHYFSSAPKRPVQSYHQLSQTMPNAHRLPLDQSLSSYQFDHSDQYGQQKQYSIPIPHGHPGYPTHETHSNQPLQPIPSHHPHSSKYGTHHPERKPHFGSHIKLTNSNPPSEATRTSMSPSIRPPVNGYAQIHYDQKPDHRFIPGSYAQLYDYSHPSHQKAHWSHIQQSPNYILPARPSPPTSAHKPSAKLLQHSYHAESEISSMYTHPTPYSNKLKPSGYVQVKQSEYTVPLHYQNVNSLSKSRYDPIPSMYRSPEHADYNTGSNYYIPRVASSPSSYRSTKYLDPSSRPYAGAGPSKAPWTQNAVGDVPPVPSAPPVPEFSLFSRSPFYSQQARRKPSAGVTRCRNYPFCPPSLDLPNFPVEMEDSF